MTNHQYRCAAQPCEGECTRDRPNQHSEHALNAVALRREQGRDAVQHERQAEEIEQPIGAADDR